VALRTCTVSFTNGVAVSPDETLKKRRLKQFLA
jgi:hypothetical protein